MSLNNRLLTAIFSTDVDIIVRGNCNQNMDIYEEYVSVVVLILSPQIVPTTISIKHSHSVYIHRTLLPHSVMMSVCLYSLRDGTYEIFRISIAKAKDTVDKSSHVIAIRD